MGGAGWWLKPWRRYEAGSSSAPVSWFASDYYLQQLNQVQSHGVQQQDVQRLELQGRSGEMADWLSSAKHLDPWQHFSRVGWRLGLKPHPWFDTSFYLSLSPDLRDSDPVSHFIAVGWQQGLAPHPLFDVDRYLQQADDLSSSTDPLSHYLTTGWQRRLSPHALISFDYLLRETRRRLSTDPMTALLARGMNDSDRSHPFFSLRRLQLRSRFVLGTDALPWSPDEQLRQWVHWSTRLSPTPLFEPDFYSKCYPEALTYPGGPWRHLIEVGQFNDFDPSPYFDSATYRRRYGHCLGTLSPLLHYLTHERSQKFDPHPSFSVSHYLARHPEVRRKRLSPLEHFLEFGRFRGAEIAQERVPTELRQQLAEARAIEPEVNVGERDLLRLQQVNRHRSVRRTQWFLNLIDQLESGFEVLLLVAGPRPDPVSIHLASQLIARRPIAQNLVLGVEGGVDEWRAQLPEGSRCVCWEGAALETLEPAVRCELTQYLIEEDRPGAVVVIDSPLALQLIERKRLGLKQLTDLWVAPETLTNCSHVPWQHCHGIVTSQSELSISTLLKHRSTDPHSDSPSATNRGEAELAEAIKRLRVLRLPVAQSLQTESGDTASSDTASSDTSSSNTNRSNTANRNAANRDMREDS